MRWKWRSRRLQAALLPAVRSSEPWNRGSALSREDRQRGSVLRHFGLCRRFRWVRYVKMSGIIFFYRILRSCRAAPEPEETCVFGNKTIMRGQRVEDGCSKICICEAGGNLKCQQRCPPNDTISVTNQHDRCVVLTDPRYGESSFPISLQFALEFE